MPFQLPTKEEKADYVERQFDRIARRYDLTNDAISFFMHRSWKRAAVVALNLKQSGHYLDVCCGTGDLSLSIASHLRARGKVSGLDFSKNMLEVARKRQQVAQESGLISCSLEWVNADAQNLPFADDSFDGAIISFGLRNLTNLEAGLQQMARVVKPGGRVVNLDLGRSRNPMFSKLFKFYFGRVVPLIGLALQNDKQAYTYLPESMNSYPAPDAISEMFSRAGLEKVTHIPLALGSVALHYGVVPEPRPEG